ncbi:MAG: hypothetical protein SVN78_01480 [Deferribacterota bacterium]|nr:hypothetical protein [Deferribacterota bacterium]
MNNIARNFILLGLGIASMTEEKAKDFYNKLIEYGKKYEESEESTFSGFLKSYDKASDKFEELSDELASSIAKKLKVVTRDDFLILEEKTNKLQEEVNSLKKEIDDLKK